jgi:X-X-X-Leu-X-X-Gly heptad repeat protein
MSLRKSIHCISGFALLLMCAGFTAAQGPAANSNTTTSQMELTATVQTAVQLNISTGSGGVSVSGSNSTGLFGVSFGNVNGLGLGTLAAGVSVVADGSGALYKTPINLTPVYSGFSTETATITVTQDAAGDTDCTREGSSEISSSSTVSTTTPATVGSGKASGSTFERYVGMYVSRTEAAGAKTATLIYTITVE